MNGRGFYMLIFTSLIFLCAASAHTEIRKHLIRSALPSGYDFRENDSVRGEYKSVVKGGALQIKAVSTKVKELAGREYRVKVSVREQNDAVYLLFINENDYSFPLYSAGTYIIKTDELTGEIMQIKIFLKTDENCFVRIFPDEGRSRMDLYLYGYPLYKSVLISGKIDDLIAKPFSDIVTATDRVVNWNLVFPEHHVSGYESIIGMSEQIRARLPGLPDADDGAMNGEGDFVFIETEEEQEAGGFNCSGFAKWIVDGLYMPIAGAWIDIDPLKRKNTDDRGNRWSDRHESSRDPYFGLDWTRNLAAVLEDARHGGRVDSDFADVRNVPFFSYTDDVGYRAEDLPIILYLLAVEEPGYFYLASVNDQSGIAPNLRQHFHVAAIFPYIDSGGDFHAPVFERNFESSVNSFSKRYPGGFVHLVRIPGLGEFTPPVVE